MGDEVGISRIKKTLTNNSGLIKLSTPRNHGFLNRFLVQRQFQDPPPHSPFKYTPQLCDYRHGRAGVSKNWLPEARCVIQRMRIVLMLLQIVPN